MKRISQLVNYRYIVIILLLTMMLTSCEQLGYLSCPSIPDTNHRISLAPYNEEVGDCALIGKSEEIEAWLDELEDIAESCRENLGPNWEDTQSTRVFLDSKVDTLKTVYNYTPPSYPGDIKVEGDSDTNCGTYTVFGSADPVDIPPLDYTSQLKMISQNVIKYCKMVDEIVKPIWQSCDEINFYQDCQAPDPEQYHSIVESQMNVAQINYDYTRTFYTNNLEIDGWDAFRTNFNESSIDCTPTQPLATNPTFTFSMNAFCRLGPTLKHEKVATFLELQSVQIFGRNQSEPLWWWVLIPGSQEHCWVANSTGKAAGKLEDLEFIAAPPLVISPVNDNQENDQPEANSCSKDLGPRACAAAGGTWEQSSAGPYYCDCN